jgi:hypothetical protein
MLKNRTSKLLVSFIGIGLSGLLVAGCGSNDNNNSEIILPGETQNQNSETSSGNENSDSNEASTPVSEAETILDSFDSINISPEGDLPEGVDPDENYDQLLERIDSSVSTSIKSNKINYKIVSVDNVDVGPNKPVKIAIIPEGKPTQSVKFATPSIGLKFTAGSNAKASNAEINKQIDAAPQVTCDKDSVLASPIVVTCTFDKAVPENSSLYFGFIVSGSEDGTKQEIELASIPLNPSARGGN